MLTYQEARETVIQRVAALRKTTAVDRRPLRAALGCVLAQDIAADRDYPPFDRSTRDGYAVRAAEVSPGGTLPCVGELKAGDNSTKRLSPGTCVQIMTGAAAPPGADAVVMIEHTSRAGDIVTFQREASAGQNIVPRGSESRAKSVLLKRGQRLGFAEIALAAQSGVTTPRVRRAPEVAILSTGDEVVPAERKPGPFQIRNSNDYSLTAQTRLAGGDPVNLGNAPDELQVLGRRVRKGLRGDALVLCGGVSMGKYDLVEQVLRELGTKFYFDAVAIRPGKPAVFGICDGVPVFGLPGNPVSTMVTFELFVVPALDILSGASPRPLPIVRVKLAEAVKQKGGVTHFLPARIEWSEGEPVVRELRWRGSGDIAALGRANCFLVMEAERPEQPAGEQASVLLRRDML
jgi:molybdopterin molybdotransferase